MTTTDLLTERNALHARIVAIAGHGDPQKIADMIRDMEFLNREIEKSGLVLALSLAGSCRNGAERDSGRLFHAVPFRKMKALCGTTYGKRSAGWSSHEGEKVTCPRCLKRLTAK